MLYMRLNNIQIKDNIVLKPIRDDDDDDGLLLPVGGSLLGLEGLLD